MPKRIQLRRPEATMGDPSCPECRRVLYTGACPHQSEDRGSRVGVESERTALRRRLLATLMRVDRWDRHRRQELLADHNEERRARKSRIQRACGAIGHEYTQFAYRDVGGRERYRCEWCGAPKPLGGDHE